MKYLCTLLFLVGALLASGQPAINNLIHTPGYKTGTWGMLGDVKRYGPSSTTVRPTLHDSLRQTAQDMILLPGWGFDQSVFSEFVSRHEKEYRMWAVTIPGFGNTPAPPMPDQNENYRDLNWTKGAVKGLADLIDKEQLKNPIVVSLFSVGNLVAMRLALDYPEKVGKLIIVSGIAKFTANYPSYEPRSLESRCQFIEQGMAPRWFKTVTAETWNKGNFSPATFSKDSLRGIRHWKMMSSVPIPVMVRYLCEFYCTDLSLEYGKLTVPTLVLIPSFSLAYLSKPENSFMAPFFHHSWLGALPGNSKIQMVTLSDTHAFMMDDQPEKFDKVVREFIAGTFNPSPVR